MEFSKILKKVEFFPIDFFDLSKFDFFVTIDKS